MLRSAPCTGALLLLACDPGTLPGVHVGSYQIQGALQENSCGVDALAAVEALDFGVEVRRDGETGLWYLNGSNTPVSGSLGASGSFTFVQSSQYTAVEPRLVQASQEEPWDYWGEPPSARQDPGCTLVTEEAVSGQLDSLSGQLDAGERLDLVGTHTITVRALAGSNCLPVLAIDGGPFQELPCRAVYALTGQGR